MRKPKYIWTTIDLDGWDAFFSTKEKAKYFFDNVWPPPKLLSTQKISGDNIDIRLINAYDRRGPYVYYIEYYKQPREEWTTLFYGFYMDLADRADVVFETEEGVFGMSILAHTYYGAIQRGTLQILKAIAYGPFDGEYDRPGYIRAYHHKETPWEESPETYLR